MGRNRAKAGKLASECPERIGKYLQKYHMLEKAKAHMRSKLQLDRAEKTPIGEAPEDSCTERIEKIKKALKALKTAVRALEIKLGISRKQSEYFQGKGHRSKVEKLTKGRE